MKADHIQRSIAGPDVDAGTQMLGDLVARLAGLARNRMALWATVAAFAALMWMVPRLPMVDLPQNAGQVGLWRDLMLSASPWSDLLRINLGTPYLLGYALALPLSFLMLPGTALKVVLTAALIGYIASAIALRKEVGADERLDWLFLPSFFSLSWQWGFYSFLIAAPLMLVLIHMTYRHMRLATPTAAAAIVAVGVLLLLAHGLAFLFACLVAGMVVLTQSRSIRRLALAIVPFVVLGVVVVAFMLATRGFDTPPSMPFHWIMLPHLRLSTLYTYSHSFNGDLAVLTVILLFLPSRLGLRLNRAALVPIAVLVVWVMTVPHAMLGAGFYFHRFSMLTMVFFALVWAAPARGAPDGTREQVAALLLVASAWISVAAMAYRLDRFSKEAADFEIVLAAAEPAKRALAINMDHSSPAAGLNHPYMHFASWYQSEKRGLVDYNFATFHNMIVRYRPEHKPAVGLEFEWDSHLVEWDRHNARIYDYYFVRHAGRPLPSQIVDNPECRIETVATAGTWTLLRRGACRQ